MSKSGFSNVQTAVAAVDEQCCIGVYFEFYVYRNISERDCINAVLSRIMQNEGYHIMLLKML